MSGTELQRPLISNRLYVPKHLVTEQQMQRFRYLIGTADDQQLVQTYTEHPDSYGFCRGDIQKIREVFDLRGIQDQRARVPWPAAAPNQQLRFTGILEDDQQRCVEQWRRNPYGLLHCPPRYGKGEMHGTPVLTPTGWTPIEHLRVGDLVIGSDGRPTEVTGVFPRGRLPVNRVEFTDKCSIVVDDDHLWQVLRCEGSAAPHQHQEVKTTRALRAGRQHRLMRGNTYRYRIPLVQPVQFAAVPRLPIDPYLLGVMLGSWHRRTAATGVFFVRHTVDGIVAEMNATLVRRQQRIQSLPPAARFRRLTALCVVDAAGNADPAVLTALRAMHLLDVHTHELFIPQVYLLASVQDRTALLQGLLDTVGQIRKTPYTTQLLIKTGSARLHADFAFLVQGLGGLVYPASGNSGASISLPPTLLPFRARASSYTRLNDRAPIRAIRSITQCGTAEVTCIAVAALDRLYVTEHCIVTHNTICAVSFLTGLRQRALVLVHRIELADQFMETFEEFTNIQELEARAGHRLIGISTGRRRDFPLVTVATYQQFMQVRGYVWLKQNRDAFGAVMVDEAHRAKAEWYSKVVNLTNPLVRVGMTATPYDSRNSTHVVAHDILGPVVAKGKTVELPTDYCLLRTGRSLDDASEWTYYINQLCRDRKRSRFIAKWVAKDVANDRFCLVTTDRIQHLEDLAEEIRLACPDVRVETISGTTPKALRRDIRLQARSGQIRVVIAINQIIQEGYNVPRWSVLHNTCPLTSPENWFQRFSRVRTKYFANEVAKFGAYNKPRPMLRVYVDETNMQFQRAAIRMIRRECGAYGLREVHETLTSEPRPAAQII